VAVNDYRAERAEAVAGQIRDEGGTPSMSPTSPPSGRWWRGWPTNSVRSPILVNNAGNSGADPSAGGAAPFWETDPAAWEPFLAVNLYGVLACCRAVIPGMIKAGHGRLITIISDAGRVGEPGLEAHSAAKAGAASLMRALARSLGRYLITRPARLSAWSVTSRTVRPSGWRRHRTCQPLTGSRARLAHGV
jgi:3-oxoacyl-[acyl-carrier protein] reductase